MVCGGPNMATSQSNKLSSFTSFKRNPSNGSSFKLFSSWDNARNALELGTAISLSLSFTNLFWCLTYNLLKISKMFNQAEHDGCIHSERGWNITHKIFWYPFPTKREVYYRLLCSVPTASEVHSNIFFLVFHDELPSWNIMYLNVVTDTIFFFIVIHYKPQSQSTIYSS